MVEVAKQKTVSDCLSTFCSIPNHFHATAKRDDSNLALVSLFCQLLNLLLDRNFNTLKPVQVVATVSCHRRGLVNAKDDG